MNSLGVETRAEFLIRAGLTADATLEELKEALPRQSFIASGMSYLISSMTIDEEIAAEKQKELDDIAAATREKGERRNRATLTARLNALLDWAGVDEDFVEQNAKTSPLWDVFLELTDPESENPFDMDAAVHALDDIAKVLIPKNNANK